MNGTGGVRRGLLVHAGALGDFLLSLRVVNAMRLAGIHRITVLGRPSFTRLARLGGAIDDALDYESGGFHALFREPREGTPCPSALAAALAGYECTVNMAAAGHAAFTRQLADRTGGRVIDLDPRPRAGDAAHVTEQWLARLADAGLPADAPPPRLVWPAMRIREARPRWMDAPASTSPPVLMHPGSGGAAKCWPVECFVELARSLQRSGRPVRWLLGPAEREGWSVSTQERLAEVAPVCDALELLELADALAIAGHVVANDSGVAHLAAALDAPLTVVFGATDPRCWRPLGERVRVAGELGAWPSVEHVADVVGRADTA